MSNKFTIPGKLIGMNQYDNEKKSSYFKSNTTKKETQEYITYCIKKDKVRSFSKGERVCLYLRFFEGDRKRDCDNIISAVKFIQDAMVSAGILPNDSQRYLQTYYPGIYHDKLNPRVEVLIMQENAFEGVKKSLESIWEGTP